MDPRIYEEPLSSRSNSQNLMSLSALPVTKASPSGRTWIDQTVEEWALIVSNKDDEAMSYNRISPSFVPTAI